MPHTLTLTALRHPNAEKAAHEGHHADMDRRVSEKGIEQIVTRQLHLKGQKFDAAFASPAKRCTTLAGELAAKVTVLEALCFDAPNKPVGKLFDRMFKKLGHAPLVDYLVSDGGHYVRDKGHEMWKHVVGRLDGTEKHVLVVSHGVITVAMAFSQLDSVQSEIAKTLLAANLGEAEGYTVLVEDGKIVSLSLIKD